MKNQLKIALISIAVIGAQVGCEKEIEQPVSATTNSKATKTKATNSKSVSLTYSEIDDYVTDLENGNSPTTEEWEKALILIESAINHTEATWGQVSTHSEILEFTTNVTITEDGGVLEVSASDALDFYDNLKTDLDDAVQASDLYAEHSNDVFVTVVDLQFETPSGAGSLSVPVTAFLKFDEGLTPLYPSCESDNDWKALDQLGKCSGGTNLDAAIRLESFLTNDDCNSNLPAFTCQIYNTTISIGTKNGFQTTNIWNGTAPSNCITDGAINLTYYPGMLTEADNMAPAWPNDYQYDYAVDGTNTKLATGIAHRLRVSYARFWCPPFP